MLIEHVALADSGPLALTFLVGLVVVLILMRLGVIRTDTTGKV